MDLASVEARLDALEAEGARGFDAPACDCVRTLLTQAEELGGAVAERLAMRAGAHLTALSARLAADRTRVQAQLAAFEAKSEEVLPDLHKQLERGETTRVARTLRRIRSRPPRLLSAIPSTALARIDPNVPSSEAAGRGAGPRTRISVRQKQALAYEDSVAELVASFALARAVDVVPEDAGPYNALRIASEALDKMRALSPFYLTVQLNRLEELASLLSLPELPSKEPPPTALPRKKRGNAKGSS